MSKSAVSKYRDIDNARGKRLYFEATANAMDDDLRDQLNYLMAPCTDEEFLEAYCEAHEKKFGGEIFVI